ncbi:hypothetical protein [Empedobacter brevis]|uniref:hypothetical protein n=1 Tax=Empedobacter brevis TaxID=247 RepID=UPI00289D181B|nr:hypothetical protein [Empedobacter brevis]
METYKIEIYGEDENQIQRMEEVIAPIKDIQDYFWKILWIDGESETDEYSVFELQEVIDQQDGIFVEYDQLESLSYKMETVTEALIIGDRKENNLHVNIEDENLYDNEVVFEFVKDSHWQILTSDINIVDTFKVFFPNSKIID